MNFESLIFDIDGTLWDSRALVAEAYNIQMGIEGLTQYHFDAQVMKTVFGKVMKEIGDILFVDIPEEERYSLLARCVAREDQMLHDNTRDLVYTK